LTVARFQSEQKDSPRVLFVSHQHHASGLNLHVASHVIVAHPYAAPVTSPTAPELAALSAAAAFERQAVGRVRRFPQTKPCRLYRLYARGTVEEELYAVWGWI
jgi:SNF2 family DNA or RNA helicase